MSSDMLKRVDDTEGHFFWEAINTAAYELGGFVFLLGSIPFLPAYNKYLDVGVWLFIVGSLLYLVVAVHDCFEVLEAAEEHEEEQEEDSDDEQGDQAASVEKTAKAENSKHFSRKTRYRLDLFASLIYVSGSLLFIVGSLVFLPALENAKLGAILFIIGSVLFGVGALVNMVQIFDSHDASSITTALLANLTAAFYLIGSTMFGVASVPYLFDFEATADATLIYTFLGWNYILGSLAFTIGGTINYLRARIVLQDQVTQHLSRKKAKQQLHDLHQQQKEQNYSYNHTWGAQASSPLYQQAPPPHQEQAGEDEAGGKSPRVMWQDLQKELAPQSVEENEPSSTFQNVPSGQATKVPLLEMFQQETPDSGHAETTGLLSNPPSDAASTVYGSKQYGNSSQ